MPTNTNPEPFRQLSEAEQALKRRLVKIRDYERQTEILLMQNTQIIQENMRQQEKLHKQKNEHKISYEHIPSSKYGQISIEKYTLGQSGSHHASVFKSDRNTDLVHKDA
mmetsp:Transcript_38924/g.59156  ORF Transcript_38924/g.59156 Transcript_38924/m.59156 type:complete len:109 (+) Transcript_38924:677-1003(+)